MRGRSGVARQGSSPPVAGGFIPSDYLLPDVDEEGVVGYGLADLVDVSFRGAPDLFFVRDLGVFTTGDSEAVRH